MQFKRKKFAVAGFNARPIAWSLAKAGAKVYVSDYWGDDDLAAVCSEWVSVLNPRRGQRHRQPLEQPVHLSLAKNLVSNFNCADMDYILVGSGFDDHPASLRIIEEAGLLVGNDSERFIAAREWSRLRQLAKKYSLNIPERFEVKSTDQAIKAANVVGYPCLLRPTASGGGTWIRFVKSEDSLSQAIALSEERDAYWPRIIQQYVPGVDCSCSLLANGQNAFVLSFQGQLIGIPSAGRNCDFVYSGNYIPLSIPAESKQRAKQAFVSLVARLGLLGSNGIDFIVDKTDSVWLIEINPRIQATLEMLELAGNISVSSMHLDAWTGMLPEKEFSFIPATRMIVYSRRDGFVPDLSSWPATRDRSPEGSMVAKGDPICSLLGTNNSLECCYGTVQLEASQIQRAVRKVDKPNPS